MNRQDLLKALKAAMPGISKGEALLAGADSFIFGDGLIRSYNDRLSITYPFDTRVSGAVKGQELVKVIDKMAGLDVTLSETDSTVEVSDGVTSLSMRKIECATTQMIEALELESLNWSALPGGFVKAVSLCLPSISRNAAHGALMGIRVDSTDVMSSDNFRATWFVMDGDMEPFTIPGPSASDLLKLGALEQYAVSKAWVHFMSADGAVFSSRLLASEFPLEPLKRMFPDEGGEQYVLPEGLGKAIERAGVLASQQDGGFDYISLKPGDKKNSGYLMVTSSRQYGSIVEKVKLQDGGWPDGSININPDHITAVMARTGKFRVVGNLACFDGEGFRHIISLIATEQPG